MHTEDVRRHPLWLRIALNASGPLGLGATLLNMIRPTLGVLAMLVGFGYVFWEVYPSLKRLGLIASLFILAAIAIGGMFAWGYWPASTSATVGKVGEQTAEGTTKTEKRIDVPIDKDTGAVTERCI